MTIRELLQVNFLDLQVIDVVFTIILTVVFVALTCVLVGIIKDIWRY